MVDDMGGIALGMLDGMLLPLADIVLAFGASKFDNVVGNVDLNEFKDESDDLWFKVWVSGVGVGARLTLLLLLMLAFILLLN